MERLYKIRKGLDLNLKGEAAMKMQPLELAETYAISPTALQASFLVCQ